MTVEALYTSCPVNCGYPVGSGALVDHSCLVDCGDPVGQGGPVDHGGPENRGKGQTRSLPSGKLVFPLWRWP